MSKQGFSLRLAEAATLLKARYTGTDVILQGVSTDSRKDVQGTLYVALRGPNFDAHAFVHDVQKAGAAACMVDREIEGLERSLIVKDTHQALGELASLWRKRFSCPVIAITGSNGKTTVKEMIAAILSQQGKVMATQGNLNNDIGVPLTLFRMSEQHQYAVIEMGANHHGEIKYLAGLTQPDVAVITNAGPAHLEGFGSVEGVSRAKGEIYSGLTDGGVAIINADDDYAGYWKALNLQRRTLTFGIQNSADVSATLNATSGGNTMQLHTPVGGISITLRLLGRHNAMNALAATASAIAVGISLDRIKAGLEGMHPVKGRLQSVVGVGNARIIDDTYNANPASLQAALDVLTTVPGSRWLALGDMGELGDEALTMHSNAGVAAKAAGVDRLYTLGELASRAAQAYGPAARHFDNHDAMVSELKTELKADVTLLVKGSRRSRMDKIVTALTLNGEA